MQIEDSIFKFLSSLFKKHDIPAILVGGYALIANKVQRMTFDIDFLVTERDILKIEQEIIKAGYSVFNRQDAFLQFKSSKKGLRDIDFLISDPGTINILISQGNDFTIDGEAFIIPSPNHLIAMKLHSIANNKARKLKDLQDIIQLIVMNGIDPANGDIKRMFKKYNAWDLYEQEIKILGEKHES